MVVEQRSHLSAGSPHYLGRRIKATTWAAGTAALPAHLRLRNAARLPRRHYAPGEKPPAGFAAITSANHPAMNFRHLWRWRVLRACLQRCCGSTHACAPYLLRCSETENMLLPLFALLAAHANILRSVGGCVAQLRCGGALSACGTFTAMVPTVGNGRRGVTAPAGV